MPRALLLIAQRGFQDIELNGTRKGLQAAGFDVVLGSKERGECIGKFGATEQATVAVRDVQVSDYDRVAFIGGPGAGAFKDDPEFLDLARKAAASGRPLGAICIAPTLLAAAGVLKGKKATVWNGDGEQGKFLESHGALYQAKNVVTEGTLVTADGPEAAQEFGNVLALL